MNTLLAPSSVAYWTISRRKYNKEIKAYEIIKAKYDGDKDCFLKALVSILNSAEPECEIDVDATTLEQSPNEIIGKKDCTIDLPIPMSSDIFWKLSPGTILEEEGFDLYELVGAIEYLLEDNQNFSVDLSWVDPSPIGYTNSWD